MYDKKPQNSTYVLSGSSCGLGIKVWLNWVLHSGSLKTAVSVSAKPCSHLEALGKNLLLGLFGLLQNSFPRSTSNHFQFGAGSILAQINS